MALSTSTSEVDRVKKKVDEMYRNYGLDPDGLDDADLGRVYKYYIDNVDELESDYKDSKKSAKKFSDDDII